MKSQNPQVGDRIKFSLKQKNCVGTATVMSKKTFNNQQTFRLANLRMFTPGKMDTTIVIFADEIVEIYQRIALP